MKSSRVIHPFLFAIFPIVFLFLHNIAESAFVWKIAAFRLGIPILISLTVTAFTGIVLNRFLFHNAQKTGLWLSCFLFLFFSCGHVYNMIVNLAGSAILLTIAGVPVGPYKIYVAFTFGILIAFAYFLRRTQYDFSPITRFLNLFALMLLLLSLMNVALVAQHHLRSFRSDSTEPVAATETKAHLSQPVGYWPDIYYLILDAYPAAQTLQKAYGYDNQPFITYLTQRGFSVLQNAHSNYTITMLSLASSLNMSYINHLAAQIKIGDDFSSSDFIIPIKMIEDNEVLRFLKSNGYKFINFSSGSPATERNSNADWDVKCRQQIFQDRFFEFLIETTMLAPIFRQFPQNSKREIIECQLSGLLKIRDISHPFFAFAHILVPHEPYVFDPNGEPVSEDDQKKGHPQLYYNQIRFINMRLQPIIETILERAEQPPIIILQGDHGFRHRPFETHQEEWFGILMAAYLPQGGHSALYDSMTPVNLFRSIFNYYFDANFELLPDQSFFPYGEPYQYHFVNVNERLATRKF